MTSRGTQALQVRQEAAQIASLRPHAQALTNADESTYRIGSDGLPVGRPSSGAVEP